MSFETLKKPPKFKINFSDLKVYRISSSTNWSRLDVFVTFEGESEIESEIASVKNYTFLPAYLYYSSLSEQLRVQVRPP